MPGAVSQIRTTALSSSMLLGALFVAACSGGMDRPTEPSATNRSANLTSPSFSIEPAVEVTGAVYTETNGAATNEVIAFHRAEDGTLVRLGAFATGGRGIGGTTDPLFSQFAVLLDEGHQSLFAVSAGSNELSSFRVEDGGALTLANTVSSGGETPVSIAEHGHLVYVLNSGDNTVSGFRVAGNARLESLPNSTRSLASGASGGAAVRFTPDGQFLIVSERGSNRFETFLVDASGRLGSPVVSSASGGASFGFDVTPRNQPVVSETQGAISSYALNTTSGALTPITASAPTHGVAACWVTITTGGGFAYTTNAGSNFLSGFAIDAFGHLTPLSADGRTGESGDGASPIDLDHVGSRFLYVLNTGHGTIGTFNVNADGSLTSPSETPAGGASSGLQGVAAF